MADTGDTGKSTVGGKKAAGGHKFQAPKGTRDFYPEDMLRKRYIVETWRAVSLRHGFEEIDGPTFEHLELYTVKSGEGIVSELFSFCREGGDDTYALRPEFTPTLARMYAARAAQLPKPVRWFCVPSFFRAERPQRGRLREFLQWNCDVIGGGDSTAESEESAAGDGEIVGVAVGAIEAFRLDAQDVRVSMSHRAALENLLLSNALPEEALERGFATVDAKGKMTKAAFVEALSNLGMPVENASRLDSYLCPFPASRHWRHVADVFAVDLDDYERAEENPPPFIKALEAVWHEIRYRGLLDRLDVDYSVARGLAYYTGTVFELLAEGERAVAGGGRYDNLIELLGGPPTPAVGFAMGDVVLANLLDDKNLMPQGAELASAVEAVVRSQRIRPEVFVVAGGEEDDAHVVPLVARLRRGVEANGFTGKPWDIEARYTVRPMHVRSSDKATRNTKKLLQDAVKQGARLFCEIHGADKVELKDLDRQAPVEPPKGFASFSIDPIAPNYVGRGVQSVLG